jgi:ABC-type glycerol-3-phosphate transport system permease component
LHCRVCGSGGSASIATGVFLSYLVPETLLFLPLFKMFAVFHEYTGMELINRWWVLLFVYPTLTVPFCTWGMIGYFASIPRELDEAALIDGANYRQVVTRIFIPVTLPGEARPTRVPAALSISGWDILDRVSRSAGGTSTGRKM